MPPPKKTWGFPRWGEYGSDRETERVRPCDYHGCQRKGEHPAPKSPYTRDKWWFCEEHAAEYNRSWNFFAGMRDEDARAFAREERRKAGGYAKADAWSWGGARDQEGLSRMEREAYHVLELEPPANLAALKKRYRALAKKYHPDLNPGNAASAEKFQQVTFAYELLKGKLEALAKS